MLTVAVSERPKRLGCSSAACRIRLQQLCECGYWPDPLNKRIWAASAPALRFGDHPNVGGHKGLDRDQLA